jgi:hypothetical protein
MTTKMKIVTGFSLMMVLLAGVSLIGFSGLSSASALFLDFSRFASLNVASSDSVSGLNASAYYLEKFSACPTAEMRIAPSPHRKKRWLSRWLPLITRAFRNGKRCWSGP